MVDRKRILVTGGAGFLGSYLCGRLLAEGHEVTCLDNLYTGSIDNIRAYLDHPRFRLIQADVIEPQSLSVDRIYNLACAASPIHYQADPIATMRTNVLGALNLLELAVKCNARILQASTSEVYGDPLVHPQSEDYRGNVSITGIRACYDEGKRAAETLFYDYNRMYGTEVRIARIFNTYGPGMRADDGRVVSNFVVQALRGENLTVYGDGLQTRSFCYRDDLVRGLMALMESEEANAIPVNLGNPGEFTMLELASLVLEMTGSRSGLVFQPLPQDDPIQRRPDISRAWSLLGWQPRILLSDGLQPTIRYFAEKIARMAEAA
ncbi:UDP-glucuronic acid decarboxylase family protein [Rhizobium paknamense]|uniref:UDP-glucuronate decarboxylase n=1 Tax=Rhizobium paknamense TaxID=1206817 RepID=A0ABU0ID71_9HYPH|nr:UDP-glucuronic acid decarboxylase family protein [Rhizobium paknamense]MDQ0456175.1 UDP-glucuronate decarboxylase [Rhizobium paknamense]